MKELNVRIEFFEKCLGTASADPEVYSNFIASKAPDAPKREEEIEAIGVEEYEERKATVFPKIDGKPFFWDYQLKGFMKDSCSALRRCKGEDFSKASCSMKSYKKIIDGCIFPEPRRIMIDMHDGYIDYLQRPLRASTAQGERIALAMSETIPEGSTIEFTVVLLSDDHEKAVREWLNYGRFKGIGQWRNAGFGRFYWSELDADGNVIGGNSRG